MPVNSVERLLRVVQDHNWKSINAHLLYSLFPEGKYERPQHSPNPRGVSDKGCINANFGTQLPPHDEPCLLFKSGTLKFDSIRQVVGTMNLADPAGKIIKCISCLGLCHVPKIF